MNGGEEDRSYENDDYIPEGENPALSPDVAEWLAQLKRTLGGGQEQAQSDDADEQFVSDLSGQWEPHKHPRGQPENKGQFASKPGGGGGEEPEQKAPEAPPPAPMPAPAPEPSAPTLPGAGVVGPEQQPSQRQKGETMAQYRSRQKKEGAAAEKEAFRAGLNRAALTPERLRQVTAIPIMEGPTQYGEGERTVGDIARDMVRTSQEWLKEVGYTDGRLNSQNTTPEMNEAIATMLHMEATHILGRPGANAASWYRGKVQEALNVAAINYPEVAQPGAARTAFFTALAITSQNETVDANATLADDAYRRWKANKEATGVGTFGFRDKNEIRATKKGAMFSNFDKYDKFVARYGDDGIEQFLAQPTTVKKLMELGAWGYDKKTGKPKKPSTMSIEDGEGPDGQPDGSVFGSAMWGAKIGNGFYSNLRGEYSPVTQDLWFTRTFGRMTGTLADVSKSAEATAKTYQAFADALVSDGLYSQDQVDAMLADPERTQINQVAMEQFAIGQKFYEENNKAIQAKTVTQTLTSMKSKRVENLLTGVNDQPGSASDRAWRAGIMNRTREMLQADRVDLSNADLQALIWFPEKDLWKKLGSKGGRGGNRDYSSAQQTLARKIGVAAGMTTEQVDANLRQILGREPDPDPVTGEEPEPEPEDEDEEADSFGLDLGDASRGRGRPDGDDPGGESGLRRQAGGKRLDAEEDLTPEEAQQVFAALEQLASRIARLQGG